MWSRALDCVSGKSGRGLAMGEMSLSVFQPGHHVRLWIPLKQTKKKKHNEKGIFSQGSSYLANNIPKVLKIEVES